MPVCAQILHPVWDRISAELGSKTERKLCPGLTISESFFRYRFCTSSEALGLICLCRCQSCEDVILVVELEFSQSDLLSPFRREAPKMVADSIKYRLGNPSKINENVPKYDQRTWCSRSMFPDFFLRGPRSILVAASAPKWFPNIDPKRESEFIGFGRGFWGGGCFEP